MNPVSRQFSNMGLLVRFQFTKKSDYKKINDPSVTV